ncbi:MAG: F-box protein [Legionella longbeachae]|nr:F-box protein [Legionella longbeachae]
MQFKYEKLDNKFFLALFEHLPPSDILNVLKALTLSKQLLEISNHPELWKKLIAKDGLKIPNEETLIQSETKTYKDYYLKRSQSSLGFFEKAANGAESNEIGEVIGNSVAGIGAGLKEMVDEMVNESNNPPKNIFQVMQSLEDKKEVNPFAVFGQLLMAVSNMEKSKNENNTNEDNNKSTNDECRLF